MILPSRGGPGAPPRHGLVASRAHREFCAGTIWRVNRSSVSVASES